MLFYFVQYILLQIVTIEFYIKEAQGCQETMESLLPKDLINSRQSNKSNYFLFIYHFISIVIGKKV